MLDLRVGDRLGGGARETSWRLEEFKKRLIEVQKQPFSVTDLKISGEDVMKELQMVDAPQMVLVGMMGPIHRLVSDPYGLGYTVYFFNENMAPRDRIKLCNINGIQPNFENLSNGTYIFTTKVFTVIRTNLDVNSTAYTLWKWLQTTQGQKVIGQSGYIPIITN